MNITREYSFSTDYGKQRIAASQMVVLEDNLHPSIIQAETILLGVRVRMLVAIEVLESELFETVEDAIREFEKGILSPLVRAVTLINSVCKLQKDENGNEIPPKVDYLRFAEFLVEARDIRNVCMEYIEVLKQSTQV